MGQKTGRIPQGKFSRVKEWPILLCPNCGYTVELCHHTRNFHICPICLRQGKSNPLEKRINKV